MTNTEILLLLSMVIFVVSQSIWLSHVQKLTSKIMAKNYSEFQGFEMVKHQKAAATTKKKKSDEVAFDEETERVAKEANTMFGIV